MIGQICEFTDPHAPEPGVYRQIPLWYPSIPPGSLVLVISKEPAFYLVLSDTGVHEVSEGYLSVCKSDFLKVM
mgnify:CR=1 FL=1